MRYPFGPAAFLLKRPLGQSSKTLRPSTQRPQTPSTPGLHPQRRTGSDTVSMQSYARASPPQARGRQASSSWRRVSVRALTLPGESTHGPSARSQAAAMARCAMPPTNIATLSLVRGALVVASFVQRWERYVSSSPRPWGTCTRRTPAAVLRVPAADPLRAPRADGGARSDRGRGRRLAPVLTLLVAPAQRQVALTDSVRPRQAAPAFVPARGRCVLGPAAHWALSSGAYGRAPSPLGGSSCSHT